MGGRGRQTGVRWQGLGRTRRALYTYICDGPEETAIVHEGGRGIAFHKNYEQGPSFNRRGRNPRSGRKEKPISSKETKGRKRRKIPQPQNAPPRMKGGGGPPLLRKKRLLTVRKKRRELVLFDTTRKKRASMQGRKGRRSVKRRKKKGASSSLSKKKGRGFFSSGKSAGGRKTFHLSRYQFPWAEKSVSLINRSGLL